MTTAPAEALANAGLALARRFSAGATLYCWSPSSPSDAAHVAVEFVHPVIVGKPSLPAVAVPADDGIGFLRATVRAGDALVVVGRGDDSAMLDVVNRAPAWGVDALWLASGVEPPAGNTAPVVWLGEDATPADLVCAYHLLWELTHVCLEHPRVLTGDAAPPSSCPACADTGELGEVQPMAAGVAPTDAPVLVAGTVQTVDLSLVEPCAAGELVLVHAGVAIAKVSGATRD